SRLLTEEIFACAPKEGQPWRTTRFGGNRTTSTPTTSSWRTTGAGSRSWRATRTKKSKTKSKPGWGARERAPHTPALPLQPGRQQPSAVVVPEVRSVVLQRAVPDRDVRPGRRVHVVLLLRQVALDL